MHIQSNKMSEIKFNDDFNKVPVNDAIENCKRNLIIFSSL